MNLAMLFRQRDVDVTVRAGRFGDDGLQATWRVAVVTGEHSDGHGDAHRSPIRAVHPRMIGNGEGEPQRRVVWRGLAPSSLVGEGWGEGAGGLCRNRCS